MRQQLSALLVLGILGAVAAGRVSMVSQDAGSLVQQDVAISPRDAVMQSLRQLQGTKAPPPPKPTVECPRIRGYSEFPDTDTEGDLPDEVLLNKTVKKPQDMGVGCYDNCDCIGFSLQGPEFRRGSLKSTTRFTPGNKPGSCFYVRRQPCPHKDYVVAPGQYSGNRPPSRPPAPKPPCQACIDVGLDLFWVLLSGEKGTNRPLTQGDCDAFASSLPGTSLGNGTGLSAWQCTKLEPNDGYGGSNMRVCAGGSDAAVYGWYNKTKKEDYRYNSNFISRAIDQSICWVHGLASLTCEQGYWPFKKILCD